MKAKKTWRQKLEDDKGFPQLVPISDRMSLRWGRGTCVIPAPLEVDQIMRRVPKGKLITINEICAELARRHGATIGCPITTGIFAWIAAHAAEEDLASGRKRVTPYWRTLKSGGELNPKYPGGIERLKSLLESEGHRVTQRGKRFFVANHEHALTRPSRRVSVDLPAPPHPRISTQRIATAQSP